MSSNPQERVLEGVHCALAIHRPVPGVITIRITGQDTGELGDRPFAVLGDLIAAGEALQLFIDAREARGPSLEVSAAWAKWLREQRRHFRTINMLTRSKFVQLTADFVQRYADLDQMRLFTEAAAFDTALALACV